MHSSFNKEAIKEYSQAYSNKVVENFFQTKDKISGDEIITLTNIKQVNLFVLKLLFEAWNQQMQEAQSPYFDYENQLVKEVLTRFKNTLSRHILMRREDLEPLLAKAVYDSLLLIVSPYHYFDEELRRHGDSIEVEELKNAKKFIKVNVAILNAIIERLESDNTVTTFDPIDTLDAVLEETDLIPDEIAEHIENFNSELPIDFGKIYEEEESSEENSTSDNRDEEGPHIGKEPLNVEEVDNRSEEKQEISTPFNEIESNDLSSDDAKESNEVKGEFEEESRLEKPDNEQIEATAPENNPLLTINDTFGSGEVETLADLHHKKSVAKIETSITLNQRFMFVNGLFDGEVDTFNATIKTLDEMNDYEEAVTHMAENFDHWDSEDEDVIEFFDIVKRRFM